MSAEAKAYIDSILRAGEIHCPHCDERLEDDEHQFISYYGEDSQTEVDCYGCGKTFWLEEHVSRTYTTAKTRDGLEDAE